MLQNYDSEGKRLPTYEEYSSLLGAGDIGNGLSINMIGAISSTDDSICLLKEREEEAKVCIEKIDDISFNDRDEAPERQLQIKHHSKPADLTDRSVDLWRTFRLWDYPV